jgi:ABC-type lipoprotein export system ATPase subunit
MTGESAAPESQAPLWPLCEIAVSGLFRDRSFELAIDPVATILTGENGSGKSTVLRAIDYLATEQWRNFAELPLDGLRLTFEGGVELETATDETGGLQLVSGDDEWTFDLEMAERLEPQLRDFQALRRHYRSDRKRAEEMRARERLFFRRRVTADPNELDSVLSPQWLSDLAARFQTKLISARRLEHSLRPDKDAGGEEKPVSVVEHFAERLRDRMRDELSNYAAESRKQEKNLPALIVEAMQQGGEEDINELGEEVEKLRSEVRALADSLANVGLFHEEDPDTFAAYPRTDRGILLAIREVYRVTRERLERLTLLRSDLELFSSFVNERLTNKRIELNQDAGISVGLRTGDYIRPSQLSSGEQQLLALAHELLFGSERRSVVLLDEPELSLHVGWLQGLISAFANIGESRELQFIIATHSPSVLVGHEDRERSLDLS